MARHDHLPLFKSCYVLCLDVYKITHNFEREYKYTLGEKMKDAAHEMLDKVVETNSRKNREKVNSLNSLDVLAERLIIYFRISCDLKLISPAYLAKLAERFEDIGKQTGSWKKWAENNKLI